MFLLATKEKVSHPSNIIPNVLILQNTQIINRIYFWEKNPQNTKDKLFTSLKRLTEKPEVHLLNDFLKCWVHINSTDTSTNT